MHLPRPLFSLRWWVLAWFVLAVGVAVASPIVQPRAMEVVCSGAGTARMLVQDSQGWAELDAQGLDCPLCLLSGAAPAAAVLPPPLNISWQRLVVPPVPAPDLAAMAVPPPARGPPFLSPEPILKR